MSGMHLLSQAAAGRSGGAGAAGREDHGAGRASSSNRAAHHCNDDHRRFLSLFVAHKNPFAAPNGAPPYADAMLSRSESHSCLPPKKRRRLHGAAASDPSLATLLTAGHATVVTAGSRSSAGLGPPPPQGSRLPPRAVPRSTRNAEWPAAGDPAGHDLLRRCGGVLGLPHSAAVVRARASPLGPGPPPPLSGPVTPRAGGRLRRPGGAGGGGGRGGGGVPASAPELAPLTDVDGNEICMGYFSRAVNK